MISLVRPCHVHSFGNLGDRTVILACEDEFLCNYLSSGLRQLGLSVIASARSLQDVVDLAQAQPVPPLACISVNLPGVSPSMNAQMAEHGIPFMLFGFPWTPTAWATTALQWPFSAYQIARDLNELLRRTAIENAVPPWSDNQTSE